MITLTDIQNRFEYWLDLVNNPRYEDDDFYHSVNQAMDDIIEELYDPIRQNKSSQTFQGTQRVRDKLQTLVKGHTFSGAEISSSKIALRSAIIASDPYYSYLLYADALITYSGDQDTYHCNPTTFDELSKMQNNSFKMPQYGENPQIYWIEKQTGWEVIFPTGSVLDEFVIWYLAKARDVSVSQTTVDLPTTLFPEIAKRAAVNYLNAIESYDKSKVLLSESIEK